MLSKTKIYIDKDSLEIIAQDSSTADYYYKNIIEIFRRHAELYINLTEEELKDLKEPIDLSEPGDIFTFIEGKSIPWPLSGFDNFEALKQPENQPEINGNVIYILNKKEDAEKLRNKYGVWAIYIDDIDDDIFYYEFTPDLDIEEVPVNSEKAWEYIFDGENKFLPPSNSMVISDSNLLTNNKINRNTGENHFCGLVNLKNLIDLLLPQKLNVPYYILIVCPPSRSLEEGKMKKVVRRWIKELKQIRPYSLIVEFLITNKSVHSRDLYSNNYRIHFDKGFYVFEPWSRRVRRDGPSHNEINAYSYLCAPFRRGKSLVEAAMVDLNIMLKKYKSFMQGNGDPYIIDLVEEPIKQQFFWKNRVLF